MRLRIVQTVLAKELREMLRDRRSLLVMFGLPLVLYPILTLVIASLGMNKQKHYTEEAARIAVERLVDAPHLQEMIKARPQDFKLDTPHSQVPGQLRAALTSGQLNAVLTIPTLVGGYEQQMLIAPPLPPPPPSWYAITITLDRSRSEAPFVEQKIHNLLEEYQHWLIETRLAARHVTPDVLAPIQRRVVDIATSQQRLGKMLAMMLPLLLLMTGMLGAFFPALNATTTERELGTLESLLITPASRLEILTAKTLLVLMSGLLTALLNMFSMSLVLWRAFTMISESSTAFGISFSDLTLSYLAAVPAIIFFACLVLIVGLIARNFREANSFASPVMLLPLAAVFVGMAEPPSSNALMLVPVVNTTLIIRDVLTARAIPLHFCLAFASSCLYAGLMLSAAVRLFSNEQLVNPSWEPLNLGFRRRRTQRERHLPRLEPSVDAALAVFSVSLLLTVNVGLSMRQSGLLVSAVVTQLGMIAAPTLLLAWWSGYDWQKTFHLRLPPTGRLRANSTRPISLPPAIRWARPMFSTVGYFAAALLLGAALVPVIQALAQGQNIFWPGSPDSERLQNELLLPVLIAHPIFASLLLASLAGVTEELLYRGLIQSALRRRLPVGLAITITALLFAFAHFDFHGLPLRLLLGIILGWLAYRTNSLYPAILTHFAYDAVALLVVAFQTRDVGLQKTLAGAEIDPFWWIIAAAVGTVTAAVCGWAIYTWTQKTSAPTGPTGPTGPRNVATGGASGGAAV